jgi:Family of unknown function (DUF6159)
MEAAWQHGFAQQPQGKRHNRAFRLARAAWRLARRDPALPFLALLMSGSIAVAVVALVAAASHLSHGIHALSLFFLLLLGAGFGVNLLVSYFGAALAHAASAGFDGVPMTVREAVAEARGSLGPLLAWAAIATGILVATELIGGTGHAGILIANLGIAAWSFLVAFVVPIVALDAAGAGEAIGESAALARRRWGEELVGGFTIAILWALAAFVCLMVYVPGLHAFQHHHGDGSFVAMVAGGLAGLLTVLYGTATAQAFAVALLRFDSGESTIEELERPPAPIHSSPAAPRIAWLALCTAAVVGFVALVASVGIAERSERYYLNLPTSSAVTLEAGAPVVYEEEKVGEVLTTLPEGSVTQVSFEVKESIASEAGGDPIQIDTCDGSPCLRIGSPSPPGFSA